MVKVMILAIVSLCATVSSRCVAQEVTLPPLIKWHGKSEKLIAEAGSPWETPAEASGFKRTPDYAQTKAWFEKLAEASPLISLTTIGQSAAGYDILMLRASADQSFHQGVASDKPLLLVQCGIHAGEIDGKDASMMLLRDMAMRGKKELLDQVNLLIIPILNVDGHERVSPHNRINQRGPENMGWRTNSRNLNLNRDYAKLDTDEIKAVLNVINQYTPDLYFDVHVTDGADYQYDITYGYVEKGYSPAIGGWLARQFRPFADSVLQGMGHVPGPLLFAMNGDDFSEGNMDYMFSPDFSHAYGDMRHLPTVLIENHSLKPFRQRVLGTYVLLEATLKLLAQEHQSLEAAMAKDQNTQTDSLTLSWTFPGTKQSVYFGQATEGDATLSTQDSMVFLGIKSKKVTSPVTGTNYVQWLAAPYRATIPVFSNNQPDQQAGKPKAYLIPPAYDDIIARLKAHGIQMDTLREPVELEVEMYRIVSHTFAETAFEGHIKVKAEPDKELHLEHFPAGTFRVTTAQPLGDLVTYLLEPGAGSSFFQWGFMKEIFSRTEYIEAYIMQPYAAQMLKDAPDLKAAFDKKKQSDPAFAKDPQAIMSWFYQQTPFYDAKYLLYPIARELQK